jgi:hypothetical protein
MSGRSGAAHVFDARLCSRGHNTTSGADSAADALTSGTVIVVRRVCVVSAVMIEPVVNAVMDPALFNEQAWNLI